MNIQENEKDLNIYYKLLLFLFGAASSFLCGFLLWLLRELLVQHGMLSWFTRLMNYDRYLNFIIFAGLPLGSMLGYYFILRIIIRTKLNGKIYLLGFCLSVFYVLIMFILNVFFETVHFYALIPMGNDILAVLFPISSSFGFYAGFFLKKM